MKNVHRNLCYIYRQYKRLSQSIINRLLNNFNKMAQLKIEEQKNTVVAVVHKKMLDNFVRSSVVEESKMDISRLHNKLDFLKPHQYYEI